MAARLIVDVGPIHGNGRDKITILPSAQCLVPSPTSFHDPPSPEQGNRGHPPSREQRLQHIDLLPRDLHIAQVTGPIRLMKTMLPVTIDTVSPSFLQERHLPLYLFREHVIISIQELDVLSLR